MLDAGEFTSVDDLLARHKSKTFKGRKEVGLPGQTVRQIETFRELFRHAHLEDNPIGGQ